MVKLATPKYRFFVKMWENIEINQIRFTILIPLIKEEQSGGTVDWSFMLCNSQGCRSVYYKNENCIYGYLAAWTEPKMAQPSW